MKGTMRLAAWLLAAGLFCLSAAWSPASAEVDFSYGGSLRLRQEYWRKGFDLGTAGNWSNRNFLRLKASVWGRVDVSDRAGVYLRLTSEPLYFFSHERAALDGFDSDELFIDNLYLDLREVAGLPLDLRLGRQDFLGAFGDNFLVVDGATLAGSRAFYFNAARATWRFSPDNSLDLVYLRNQQTDKYLPVINNKGRPLNRGDERAAMLYSRNRLENAVDLDPYYIYKKEHHGARRTVKTLGAFAAWRPAPWALRGQYARQFGDDAAGNDIRAQGGYLFADRSYAEAPLAPVVTLGYAYLSGDDENSVRHDGWNPLFSRYPWMSELLIFPYVGESDIAYWTNLQLYRAGVRGRFSPATGFQLNYNYLRANEVSTLGPASPPDLAALFGTGRTRGHLPQATLTHRFSDVLDGLVTAEYLMPGSFYAAGAEDAFFFRWQLQYRF